MEDEEMAMTQVHGRVKWFDPVKGFGFILSDETGSDVLLHANVLRNFGQSTVADGAEITVKVQQTQRGVQAVEVVSITPPEGAGFLMAGESNSYTAEQIAACPLEPARVKWFDKGKGFGFANVYGRSDDVFIHIEVLRMSGFADLAAGEAVCLRIVEGKRGQMAAQVLSWDAATKAAK
ncbi:cold shock domain-containing protein [Pseudorhodobacter sp. E13]|uniref:cold-shock protein n=1 Tax=Pseudorhodobacter sp. E13 TaxID=2487931 RepID=UPI000F8E6009|nr:cold shock protein [Pseudorhodobacter sp. E13]RUS60057.1 cold shock domain-containing protein [Pseudorhodobacter sp. E13]